jgi:hypothetical protein
MASNGHVLRLSTVGLWVVDTRVTSVSIDPLCKTLVVGDSVGNVQLLQRTEADEFTPLELNDDAGESLSPRAEDQVRVKQLTTAGYDSSAATAVGRSHLVPVELSVLDEEKVVSADDVPPQPRAPVTFARKLYQPEQCVQLVFVSMAVVARTECETGCLSFVGNSGRLVCSRTATTVERSSFHQLLWLAPQPIFDHKSPNTADCLTCSRCVAFVV